MSRAIRELGAALALFVLIDTLVFRAGLYSSWVAPESYAGQVQRLVAAEQAREPSGAQEVLLLGDSRMAEGFSARQADQSVGQDGYKFINGSVSGSTLRTEFYLLRQLDPTARRYAAIVVPLDDYDDLAGADDPADRALDLAFTPQLLRIPDALDFPWTFESPRNRVDSLLDILVNGFGLRLDVQDFLANPRKRIQDVGAYRAVGEASLYAYRGHSESLDGVRYDPATRTLAFPPDVPQAVRDQLQTEQLQSQALPFPKAHYRIDWLGRIFQRYQNSETRFFLIQVPRGPLAFTEPHASSYQSIEWAASQPRTTVVQADAFTWLEKPEFFFDALHLNMEGRERFSEAVSRIVTEALAVGPARSRPPLPQPMWDRAAGGRWMLDLSRAASDATVAGGLYPRDGGLTFVEPEFWVSLPAPRPGGSARINGYLPPQFERLLPLTVRVDSAAGPLYASVLTETGAFTLDVSLGASESRERLFFRIDKTLVPRDIRLNQDERPLSVGLVDVAYVADDGRL